MQNNAAAYAFAAFPPLLPTWLKGLMGEDAPAWIWLSVAQVPLPRLTSVIGITRGLFSTSEF